MTLHPKLIDFFKRHNLYNKEMFEYFEEHSTMVDSNFDDYRAITGCAYLIDNHTGVLKGLHITLPYIKDEMTMLDSVHELTHAIFTYNKIGKKFKKDITVEALPLLYEKLYILERQSPSLTAYGEHLDSMIDQNYPDYYFALNAREKLYNAYHSNPEEMVKMVEKMGQKYRFEEWKNKLHHK